MLCCILFVLDFDDEEDIDDLTALLEAEKAMDTGSTSQQG